ncbi:MAG: DUF4386 domain-containing protein [Oscillospiraceae bacterium]|nr:DUF4386 domain-containing protein [Oscillospiraceae bacterium]
MGASLVVQATTSLIGGLIGIGLFTDIGDMAGAMKSISSNIGSAYIGIILQLITALVIVVLATALYQAGKRINKTVAVIAYGFYLTEVFIHVVNQIIVFAFVEASRQFAISGDASLVTIGNILYSTKDFSGAIAMIPFGLGAILFYYLITKADIIPKWLGYWGMITVSLIFVGWSLEAFGVPIPFVFYVPYVPWEWVSGVYILTKGTHQLQPLSI